MKSTDEEGKEPTRPKKRKKKKKRIWIITAQKIRQREISNRYVKRRNKKE